eukprot:4623925-Pleurochrysis_carterae.AAC.2
MHSTAHAPIPKLAGEIVNYDIYYVSVPHVHGGQQYVINFHDHYSDLSMSYLLARKSDAFGAIQHYLGFCNFYHVTVRRVLNDNAGDLTSNQIRDFLLHRGITLNTISPHVPRQNGMCERQWRTMARDMRAKLATSKPPVSFWWYHLKPSTDVAALLPSRAKPAESAWFRFTGITPSCAGVRPIGCR